MKREIWMAVLGMVAGLQAAQAQQPSAAKGKVLYNTDCSICHTPTGAGGIPFGHAVSANLQSPHLETLYHHNDALIMRAILQAKDQKGAPLDMPMPAWQGRLTRAQAKDIIAYLHTLHS